MKKDYSITTARLIFLAVFVILFSVNSNAQYCVPSNINNYNVNYISEINLGELSNSSSGTTGAYTHYSALPTTDIVVGETLTGTVSVTLNGWNTNNNRVYIWINFNASNDSDFEDNGERFTFTIRHPNWVPGMKTIEVPISIPIPSSAQLGQSRMRVGFRQTTSQGNGFSSCNYSWVSGEVEDYTINLVPSVPPLPDIDVIGDSVTISNGSNTPSAIENTDFGSHEVFSASPIEHEFIIKNSGGANLNLTGNPTVEFVSPTADFSIVQPSTTVLAYNQEVNFKVRFHPTSPGLKQATIHIESNAANENAFTYVIQGVGVQTYADTDGDGVPNDLDLDDDNDGILDTVENACSQNILVNGGFDNATGLNLGNNLNNGSNLVQIQPWSNVVPGPDAPLNLIRVDGSGPHNYGGNPQSDARGGAGVYFDVNSSSGSIYQTFTIANETIIEYGCYFSARDNRTNQGGGNVRIRNGSDTTGDIVSSIENVVAANSSGWTYVSNVVALMSGTYTIEIFVEDRQNIDEVSVIDLYSCDYDGDGIPNVLDLDDDNDGIPNVAELGLPDHDYDGTLLNDSLQTWVDANNDGVHDAYTNFTIRDSDNDGVPDYLDLDSDNDGIFDTLEYDGFGDIDVNNDGLGDGEDLVNTNLGDGDGILSIMDNNYGNYGTTSYPDPIDSDGDGTPDYLDTDSNDASNNPSNGIDISGTIYAHLDANNDGVIDGTTDVDQDGILDSLDTDTTALGSPLDINDSYSLYFDGRNDYIQEDGNVLHGLAQATQMAWVKLDSNFNQQAAIMGQSNFWISVLSNRKVRVYMNNGLSLTTNMRLNLNEWTHITAVYDGTASDDTLRIYINGELAKSSRLTSGIIIPSNSLLAYRIGRKPWDDGGSNYFFKGELDEVRVFNSSLTADEVQKMVYQELDETDNFNKGLSVPKSISPNNVGNNLIRYYKMDTYKNDIVDNKVTPTIDEINGAKLYNIKNSYPQTAPLPYRTQQNGDWENEATWLHGDVWDIEDITNLKAWSVVKVNNDITTNKSFSSAGLIIDLNKKITVSQDAAVYNTWYLELNGTLDLQDDSQLIQTNTSDLVTSSSGKLLRRQEGTSNKYWYNYWASPIGSTGVTTLGDNNSDSNNSSNSDFSLNMVKDGEGNPMEFTSQLHALGKISTRWLYNFKNGVTYYDYEAITPSTPLAPGIGYTQKGTGISDAEQQYLFEGKPNNGTITVNVTDAGGAGSVPGVSRTDYLLGNPYPSALDLHKFIDDNEGIISGTIQLWQQWSGESHVLNEYNGGYGQVNKLGSTRAYQFIGIQGGQTGAQNGTKKPSRYLPVGQGFMVEIIGDGEVVFNNSQRVFVKEGDADGSYNSGSVFFRANNSSNDEAEAATEDTVAEEASIMKKLRLEFNSVTGPETRRELLLGFSDFTSDEFDYGYDSKNMDVFTDDLNLVLEDDNMLIQAYGPVTSDKIVPLNLNTSGSYNYSIQLTEIENFDENQGIFIKDKLTGEYFDLRNNQIYEFSSEAGEFSDRLEIVFEEEQQALSLDDQNVEDLVLYYSSIGKKIVILNPNNVEIKNIEVYNILGQSVFKDINVYQETYYQYELNNVSSGNYIVKLSTSNNSIVTKKIIVQ